MVEKHLVIEVHLVAQQENRTSPPQARRAHSVSRERIRPTERGNKTYALLARQCGARLLPD